MACIRPGIASAGGSFPLEDSLDKYRRCGRRALLLLWCLYLRVAVLVVCRVNWKSGRVGTQLTNNFVLLPTDVLLAVGC